MFDIRILHTTLLNQINFIVSNNCYFSYTTNIKVIFVEQSNEIKIKFLNGNIFNMILLIPNFIGLKN